MRLESKSSDPGMYMNGKSAGEVKNSPSELLKNPGDVISDIQRVTPSDVKKDYRLRLTGKRDPEGDDMNEAKGDLRQALHKQVGMKKGKGGKPVPNCVPVDEAEINEVDTDTLKSYHKGSQDYMTTALKSNDPENEEKFGNRLTGSGRAYQKLKARGKHVPLNNSTDEGYSPDLDPGFSKEKEY